MSLLPVDLLNRETSYHKSLLILPFLPEHFDRIQVDQDEALAFSKVGDLRKRVIAQSGMGLSLTAFMYNKPAAIFGVVPYWSGVAELWMIADNRVRSIPIAMTKTAIRLCDIFEIYMGLHRMQITVRSTDRRAVKWAQAIGFKQECVMKKYGPDKIDYILLAR